MNFHNILITIMLNKRKKYMDPTRINNYNKLLTTIDKNTTFPVSNYPIPNYPISNSNTCSEYSLTQNLFDPSQASPPNEFLQKLYKRMQIHEHSTQKLNKCA